MIIDVHSHAWSYPLHFNDDFREQARRARAERGRGELYRRAATFFDTYDLLVTPAAIVPPLMKAMRSDPPSSTTVRRVPGDSPAPTNSASVQWEMQTAPWSVSSVC